MKKLTIFMLILICLCLAVPNINTVYATDGNKDEMFVVYTSDGEKLFERSDVKVNDNYITKNFEMYEVVSVDENNKTAKAEFVKTLKKPNVSVNPNPSQISLTDKKICLYLTHNDESYVPTDGYDSIYGAGGIHDVAKALKNSFELLGINTTLNETLHIPHNSSAYSRSEVTAKELLKTNPDALFDIHRDGVSRQYYVTEVDGKERCKVRIVVGQANPNKEQNLEFALYLMSVAENMYPWLFADIYYASGHYNQALYNKMLLFEMGTYLVEKEMVFDSVHPLAEVINTALYNTTVDSGTGDITIGGNDDPEDPTINDHFNNLQNKTNKRTVISLIIIGVSVVVVAVASVLLVIKTKDKPKKLKSNKK